MDANKLFAAADTLDRIAKQNAGLTEAASVLRDLGTLKAQVAEAEARLSDAQGQIKQAQGELDGLRAQAQGTLNERAKILKDAAEEAAVIIATAIGDAAEAARLTVEANTKIKADADQYAARKKAEADKIIAEAKAEADAVKATRDEAIKVLEQNKAVLSDIEARLQRAKEAARRQLEG